jgi:hypothetical protein
MIEFSCLLQPMMERDTAHQVSTGEDPEARLGFRAYTYGRSPTSPCRATRSGGLPIQTLCPSQTYPEETRGFELSRPPEA